ncbi:hypothetical protein B0H14DRAFT_3497156 [Mycena olivaceomarginata]|nr:hypothetical protein B0H14DRAFT_3497156 [Mycena olivaceomarginata]
MALLSGHLPVPPTSTNSVPLPSASDASGTVSSAQATTAATEISPSLPTTLSSSDAPASSASTNATSTLPSSSSTSVSTTVVPSSLSDNTSSTAAASNSATGGTTNVNIGTQTLTSTQFLSASSTPSSSPARAAATSGTPCAPSLFLSYSHICVCTLTLSSSSLTLFHNTAAVAGVFTAVGILSAILLIYLLTLAIRRRRQRALDREMDQVMFVPASLRAIVDDDDGDGPRGHLPSLDLSSGSHGYSAASHGTFPQQRPEYEGYDYDYGYAQSEYSDAGVAGVGAARSMPRKPSEPHIVQPQRAKMHLGGLSSTITTGMLLKPLPHRLRRTICRNYTSPPVESESPTTDPPPLPNPHGGDEPPEKRVLKVTNE